MRPVDPIAQEVRQAMERLRVGNLPTLEELLAGKAGVALAETSRWEEPGEAAPKEQDPSGQRELLRELNEILKDSPAAIAFLVWEQKFGEDWRSGPAYQALSEEQRLGLQLLLAAHAHPYCLAVGHLEALTRPRYQTRAHQEIAAAVIFKETGREARREEVEALAGVLLSRLQQARSALDLGGATVEEVLRPASEDGMLLWDARAARVLEAVGETGQRFAEGLRARSRARWEAYSGAQQPSLEGVPAPPPESLWSLCWANTAAEVTPLRFAWNFARVLWFDVVKPRLGITPTLQLDLERAVLATYGRRGGIVSADGKQLLRDGEVIADIPALPAPTLVTLTDAVRGLGSLDMARAIPYLVRRGWEQRGQPNDADVIIPGGFEGFAVDVLGIKGNDGPRRAKVVVEAGRRFCRDWPGGGFGGLWGHSYEAAKGQRAAELTITLMPVLRPHSHFGRKLSPWLAPVLAPPPLVPRERDHAAQAFFAMRLMLELVEHRIELPDGGAILTRQELEHLAREVGLPIPTLDRALDRWRQDGDDGEAFLEIDGDPRRTARYMLADRPLYRAARSFLLKGAQRTLEATSAAKRSLSIKEQRIRGRKPKKK